MVTRIRPLHASAAEQNSYIKVSRQNARHFVMKHKKCIQKDTRDLLD